MSKCVQCFYAKRSTIATYEPAWTCLHPLSRDAVGYPHLCRTARMSEGFCGEQSVHFMPLSGSAQPLHFFKQ